MIVKLFNFVVMGKGSRDQKTVGQHRISTHTIAHATTCIMVVLSLCNMKGEIYL